MSDTIAYHKELNLDKEFDLNLEISYSDNDEFKEAILYQSAFLSFLKLDKYVDKEVNRKMNKLYKLLHKNTFVSMCIEKLKDNSNYANICIDDTYVFLLLFSCDYFDTFYKCIRELYSTGNISNDNQESLLKIIEK